MTYKLLYIVAEEVGLKTKGLSGTLQFHEDHVLVSGQEQLLLPYSQIEQLRIFRQHRIGTLIHARCAGQSVFLTVPRFNLFGVFAVIHTSRTQALYAELLRRTHLAAE